VEVDDGPDGLRVRINDTWHDARLEQIGESALYTLLIDGRPHELFAVERAEGYDIVIGWDRYSVAVGTQDRRAPPASPASSTLEEHPAGGWIVLSPMTGVVVDVYAKAGDKVVEGDVLLVIEAMKMNNELRAQKAGAVREVYVKEGQRVEPGTPLLVLE
jgi:oxaloacetate decarboxylase alpha subunit